MDKKQFLKAGNSGESMLATITESRPTGTMILRVDGTTNFPEKFIATTGQIDINGYLVADTMNVLFAHIDTRQPNLVFIDGWADGYSDRGNTVGDKLVIKPTTEWANTVATGLANVGNIQNITNNEYIKVAVSETQPEPSPTHDILWLKPIGDE